MKRILTENSLASGETTFVFNAFVPTGLEDYVEYFKSNFGNFIYLRFKFPHSGKKGPESVSQIFEKGRLKEEHRLFSFSAGSNRFLYFLLLPLNYAIYLFQALSLIKRLAGKKTVVYMGANYFCAFCGILLKYFGTVDFVIYRVMDFFPLPRKGIYRFLNRIFYGLDSFCLKKSDSVWFTTEGHIFGREEYGYFDRKKNDYRIIPLGINTSRFVSREPDKNNRHSLLYCGLLSKQHLLGLIFDCVGELKKEFPGIRLNVIGSGPDEGWFRSLALKMGLGENIIFHGFMEDSAEFARLISDNALGFALYEDKDGLMKYTEPAKVKYYLNFGVPAVISRIPAIAFELEKKEVSFAVNNEKNDICRCIKRYLQDEYLQRKYKGNIAEYVKGIDINKLLKHNLTGTFGSLR